MRLPFASFACPVKCKAYFSGATLREKNNIEKYFATTGTILKIMEKHFSFTSEGYEIEGLIDIRSKTQGVVITHPHPLYGGDMYNIVVESIAQAYQEKNYTTLRFNFRGVGGSQGRYDKGVGEQADVIAAISHLRQTRIEKIDLAGYSFGAWINALVSCRDSSIHHMIMVSPPVGVIDFQPVTRIDRLHLTVTGSRDEFAPADKIEELLPIWNDQSYFEIIARADHFYGGYLEQLESILAAYI